MKKLLLALLLLGFALCAFAQEKHSILLKNGTLDPSEWKTETSLDVISYEGHYYPLVQFQEIPSLKERQQLEAQGITFISYIPNNAYRMKVPKNVLERLKKHPKVRWAIEFPFAYKIDDNIATAQGRVEVDMIFNEALSRPQMETLLQGKNISLLQVNGTHIRLETEATHITALAEMPLVAYISQAASEARPLTAGSKSNARANYVNHGAGRNLTGNGVVVTVGDAGGIIEHPDLNNRIQNEQDHTPNSHGANVAGIIASEGILDEKARGYASQSQVYLRYYTRAIIEANTDYTNRKSVITNNSYSNLGNSDLCTHAGNYTTHSATLDELMGSLNHVSHVFAAGNSGGATCSSYPAGYATVHNHFQAAKNPLVVGAIQSNDAIASISSRGPTKDGRIKPEIVAVGTSVYTTNTNNNYNTTGSGTSFSAPAVTGGLALLYQQYKAANGGNNPNNDLMKAIVCNTARDLGNTGPDYIYGFGAMDLYRATNAIANNYHATGSIANSGNRTHSITVPANATQLKVMLYWNDKKGDPVAASALVNNLDLTVQTPSSSTVTPLVLDATPANVGNAATNGTDNINNMEQVVINNPAEGSYTVNVAGTAIPMGTQNYVIVYDIITPHLQLDYPIGGETFAPEASVTATWSGAGHDATNYTLDFSSDGGSTWTTLDNAISGTSRSHTFNLPTGVTTNQGRVRLSWGGGLNSQSLSNFTIMGVPTGLTSTVNCDGSANIAWNAVTGATGYDVMEYTGGAWTVIANNINTTTHNITGLTNGQTYLYAVRAKKGSVTSSRSTPISITAYNNTPINTFPYQEDFEANNGNWVAYGKNNSWAWGTPNATQITGANSGTKAWVTNLTGNYNNASLSYLVSPCFNLSSMTRPVISFAMIKDIEDAYADADHNYFDYAKLEYSTDGKTWTRLGVKGSGVNWYNNDIHAWDDTRANWHTTSYDIPTTANRVQFRFLLFSDNGTVQEGLGIDDIKIYDTNGQASIYDAVNTVINQTNLSGTNWINFESGGNIVAAINPNGNNLGNTSVNVYTVNDCRDNGTQYYLNRNWKISPTNTPTSNVGVRLYFTKAEVAELKNKTGGTCATCNTIREAGELGFTKYSGTNEDGDLSNNAAMTYTFIDQNNIQLVPHANGYYAEFEVNSFSEFYGNGGGADGNTPLPVELFDIIFTRLGGDVHAEWTTVSEENSEKFIVEVAKGDAAAQAGNFQAIGEVTAVGQSTSVRKYNYIDETPHKKGRRYYRLQMLDRDGSFEYSKVQMIDFEKDFSIAIYPNPTQKEFSLEIYSNTKQTATVTVTNTVGQVLISKDLSLKKGTNTIHHLWKENTLPSGTYFIQVESSSGISSQSLYKTP